MASVPVKLKWGKKAFDIEINTSGTVADLKAQLLALTGVPVARQKLMAKGVWKGTLKDATDLSTLTFKKNQKVMLMGKASAIPSTPAPKFEFIEDMTKAEAAKVGAVIPAGFKNLGNTCYMNSTLQCLRAVPELRTALNDLQSTTPAMRDGNTWLATSLAQSFNEIDSVAESYPPVGFVTALRRTYPQFDEVDQRSMGHKQQDADELYNNVMTSLSNVLTKPTSDVDISGTGNVVDALFQIRYETKRKCLETDEEPEQTLSFSMRKIVCNITGGAGSKIQVNHLHEGIKLGLTGELTKRSEVLGRDAKYSNTHRITRLPKYMCVQFMRFFWKETPDSRDRAGVNCKMMRPVQFPIDNMDVYDFCAPALQKKLKVYRDAYAERALSAAEAAAKKTEDESKGNSSSAAAASTPAAGAGAGGAGAGGSAAADESGDTNMGNGEDDDPELLAALALSLQGGDGDVKMEEDAGSDDLLGPGIPKEFRGLYECFAVVSHKGRSASSGHYMGWVRRQGDDWLCFDDDAVSPCKSEHVKALKGGGDWDMTYLVFYRAKE